MEKRINFEKLLLNTIENIKISGKKPKLLLHACCGPCFTIPFEILKDHFDITVIYNNSNIYPESEYSRRLAEFKKYLNDNDIKITFIECDYDNEDYNKILEKNKDDKEGHERCRICFRKRLGDGFKYASENGFDYFGTVMTISRYKNAQDINKIGEELAKQYPNTKWLYADFKKNDGYEKSLKIIQASGMYFQEYCGCIYSYQAYKKKHEKE